MQQSTTTSTRSRARFTMKTNFLTRTSLIALISCTAIAITISVHPSRIVSGNKRASDNSASNTATVRIVERNTPYITLGDGVEIPAEAAGDNLAELRPLALASGDFDEDGNADLISAQGSAAGGVLTLYRGTGSLNG